MQEMTKRLCIIYMAHDGVISQYSGIGALTQTFLASLLDIKNLRDVDAFLIGIKVDKYVVGYNYDLYQHNLILLGMLRGSIFLVENGTGLSDQYGGYVNWKQASIEGAKVVDQLIEKHAEEYDTFLVFCVDTPFLGVPQCSIFLHHTKVRFVIALHSTAKIHGEQKLGIARVTYESEIIAFYNRIDNVIFAETSKFLGNHLVHMYSLNPGKLLPLVSGIFPNDAKYRVVPQDAIEQKLQKYGIDTTKPLIFSMGRAERYKGFDLLIAASKIFAVGRDFQLVIICAAYTLDDKINQEIRSLLETSGLSYVMIDIPDFELPKYICQRKNTKIVVQLSLAEPFGLIPEEVRCRARQGGPVILTSSKDGYIEQITNEQDGFLVPLYPEEIAKKFQDIFLLDNVALEQIRKTGYYRVCRDYNFAANLEKFLALCLDDHA